jgi:HK97 family phage prohead protease
MKEQRTIVSNLRLRADGDEGHVLIGHAPVWNRYSQNLGGFVEQVAEGACTQTVAEGDIRGLLNHDPSLLLGRHQAGREKNTMDLEEDKEGLRFEIDMPDTQVGRDLVVSAGRGDIDGASFSFRTVEVDWGFTPEDFPLRTLKVIRLYDTGPVVYPAYLDSESGLRASLPDDQRAVALSGLTTERRSIDEVLRAAADGDLASIIRADDPEEPRATHSSDEMARALHELQGRRWAPA